MQLEFKNETRKLMMAQIIRVAIAAGEEGQKSTAKRLLRIADKLDLSRKVVNLKLAELEVLYFTFQQTEMEMATNVLPKMAESKVENKEEQLKRAQEFTTQVAALASDLKGHIERANAAKNQQSA